eukprot:TRINITY_DN83161_c0_g1_i1.p1 TRINITY_DN83161_c0_g1~~TRINITY_DN83161_c0_g1_i1.p1  ORF type:complete len:309 (+),score=85.31 TRINITY_DN83161_c0_g1_i1:50-976(+)
MPKPKTAPVDYSGLEVGTKLRASVDGTFYAAEVVAVSTAAKRAKAPVKVHFSGYTDDYDEWVGADRLRSKALKPKEEVATDDKPSAEKKNTPKKVFSIALTGGPCGGKSSALEKIKDKLKEKDIDVYMVPEVPTILFKGGGSYPGIDGGQKLVEFETAIIQLQLQMEKSFATMAKSTGKLSVLICDRGLLDIAAYLPRDAWLKIIKANRLTEKRMCSFYDGVLHLVTAADGAEKFYKWGNVKDDSGNDVYRQEDPAQARELDAKMQGCWSLHKKFGKIENLDDGFQGKLDRAADFVLSVVEDGKAVSP